MTRKYSDLIYYKEDIIEAYSERRKNLSKKEVEDLLRCITLFLEQEFKKPTFSAYEIPNIGFLHKKAELSELEEMSEYVSEADEKFVESIYLDTTFTPIIVRKDVLNRYYPQITNHELQEIQNAK